MRYVLLALLLFITPVLAGPPGPPGPPGPAPSGNSQPVSPIPFVIGTVDSIDSFSVTIATVEGGGQLTPHQDFHRNAQTMMSPGVQSGDRVLVAYHPAPDGHGFDAKAVLKCPVGTDPQGLLKQVPNR